MLSKARCKKCGQVLAEDELTCWACGALTELGEAHKRAQAPSGASDEDEEWRRSVEAAKKRRQQVPAVDPDEVLQRALAEQGVEPAALKTPSKLADPVIERSEYREVRDMTKLLTYLAAGTAAILGIMGITTLAFSFTLFGGGNDITTPMLGFGIAVLFGMLALLAYYLLQLMGKIVGIVADMADNTRRSVITLRVIEKHLQGERAADKAESATGKTGDA